jgi:GNAT superfamily N-acetyltransferase
MALCGRVFDVFVGPDYEPQGRQSFHAFIEPEAVRRRVARGEMVCRGCFDGARLVGVGAAREPDHICELFVEGDCHRRGVGRLLFEAMSQGRAQMTVHASPYALEFYRRLGFVATGPEQTVDGLRFTTMGWQRS